MPLTMFLNVWQSRWSSASSSTSPKQQRRDLPSRLLRPLSKLSKKAYEKSFIFLHRKITKTQISAKFKAVGGDSLRRAWRRLRGKSLFRSSGATVFTLLAGTWTEGWPLNELSNAVFCDLELAVVVEHCEIQQRQQRRWFLSSSRLLCCWGKKEETRLRRFAAFRSLFRRSLCFTENFEMRGPSSALVVETPASLGPLPRAAAAFIGEKRREEENDADDDDESMTSKSKAKSDDF